MFANSQKISKLKTGTARCQVLRLKYTKVHFLWDSAQDSAGETYSAPTEFLAVSRGLLLRGRRIREEKGRGR